MKKKFYIVLAIFIIVGIAITSIIGLNVDVVYKAHKEVRVSIGKETNIKDVEAIAKEILGNKKIVISSIDDFNNLFLIKTESISDEEIENLKQKIKEKYEIEDDENIITEVQVPKLRLRDLTIPYIAPGYYMPILVSTVIILAYMAVRFKKLGSIKVLVQTSIMMLLSELLLLSIIAITRYPVNHYIIPAGLIVYIGTIIMTNMQFLKSLEEQNNKIKNKEKEA